MGVSPPVRKRDTDNKNKDQGVDTPRSPDVTAFKLLAPREGQREIKPGESLILRTDRDEKLIEVAQKPAWLLGSKVRRATSRWVR